MKISVKRLRSIIIEEVQAMKLAEQDQEELIQQSQELQQRALEQVQQALGAMGLSSDQIEDVIKFAEETKNR